MTSDKKIFDKLRKRKEKGNERGGKKVETFSEFARKFHEYLSNKGKETKQSHICRPYNKTIRQPQST